MKNIVIFGAPGSGKGTQSNLIIEKYGLGHISTGDVLREEIKNGTELGKTAKGFIDQGQLIPDELMISILANVYDGFGKEHEGVIFDGFPRTIPQAEALKKMLEWFNRPNSMYIDDGWVEQANKEMQNESEEWMKSMISAEKEKKLERSALKLMRDIYGDKS